MKIKEVCKILQISKPTIYNYIDKGILHVKKTPTNIYLFNEEEVYNLAYKEYRKNVIYARVSTKKQKEDLENQIKTLQEFTNKNGIKIDDEYKDIGSGINFDRKEFLRLIDDVSNNKIKKVFVTYKDRFSRIGFDIFKNLFEKFGCKIIVLNEIDDDKIIEKEIFNEIISLIHCFSMKVYSKRRQEKLKLIKKDLELEDEEN